MIAVNVDIGTQEILEQAELNPDGITTLGILSKPELVDRSAEEDVVALAEANSHPLTLGWQVVRNAGQAELMKPLAERLATGQIFLSAQSLGIVLTRTRSGSILFACVCRRSSPVTFAENSPK